MIVPSVEHARIKKIRNQHHSISSSESQSHSSAHMLKFPKLQHSKLSNNNGSSESRKTQSRNSNNKSTFALRTLRGLGCKGMAMPVSASTVRSAAAEGNGTRRKRNQRNKSPRTARSPANLADTPDICCAPPGISYLSDVVPRPNVAAQRTTHIQHSRVARRSANSHGISALGSLGSSDTVLARSQVSNATHCQHLYFRFARGSSDDEDQHREWELNVDSMSYEALLDLGDKIGHVGRGLREEEIFHCLKISKLSMAESVPLLIPTDKDWRCSICQEGCRSDVEVGRLGCGHCHHINCIKQWLLHKNECPVCKIPPVAHEARRTRD